MEYNRRADAGGAFRARRGRRGEAATHVYTLRYSHKMVYTRHPSLASFCYGIQYRIQHCQLTYAELTVNSGVVVKASRGCQLSTLSTAICSGDAIARTELYLLLERRIYIFLAPRRRS